MKFPVRSPLQRQRESGAHCPTTFIGRVDMRPPRGHGFNDVSDPAATLSSYLSCIGVSHQSPYTGSDCL
ncbi:hypothetical protein SCLCIDRAFT_1209908 [Scleroderma citrinum Foug A]|uniref:Uncharacterized protein n=1 Tax=Scleroderma citrinum Foug A TaxID=1036808 RepID=A0A0C3A281_9AGAM|nr:hypothetical protein SCLCIDRAFT_1209908 [Scleroderma citrinum Foug A]